LVDDWMVGAGAAVDAHNDLGADDLPQALRTDVPPGAKVVSMVFSTIVGICSLSIF
jgi:hypothetical protein